MPRLMAMVACHLPRLAKSPDLTLALRSMRNRSLLLLGAKRRLILLPLSTSTHVPDAPCVFYFSFNVQGCPDYRVPSSHVCRRMMCLKPLEVTRPPWSIVALVRVMVAATALTCAMMATAAPVSFLTNRKQ